ncbi:MAG: nitroreductase family deazaflavin-dependent oxidoreductase [Mycobacterium sp.]
MSSRGDINGIRRVDLETRGPWRRRIWWWMGGPIAASKTGLTVWRKVAAPIEAPLMKASRGRLKLNPAVPMVVLTTTGAKSGERREVPLAYFTDVDDVILIASNYGGTRHPSWYHNLRANPTCELHRGPLGGPFIASVAEGADRDRLDALAVDRLSRVFALHDKRSGDATTIPVMRLTLLQGEHEGQQTDGDVVEFRFQATSGQQKK